MTFRLISAIAISSLLVSCADQQPSERAIDDMEAERIMDDIEARIEMPEGAKPIDQYTRSYFERGNIIEATYVDSSRTPTEGRQWNPESPIIIDDGGCIQVNVTYDPATEEITANCNGQG